MAKFVDEYDDDNSQPHSGLEAKPADDDSQNQNGPMNQQDRYSARKFNY
jgi:hypothetical protein